MHFTLILLLGASVASALPAQNRIVGGSVTTIEAYPFGVAVLMYTGTSYEQLCGGTIINNRSVLSAAHCFIFFNQAWQVRSRVGSTWANSGGTVLGTSQIIIHPDYDKKVALDMDFAVIRVTGVIPLGSSQVRAANIAGPNYNLGDNQSVWAIGWGTTCSGCPVSEQLRHVQIWTVNQNICAQRYSSRGMYINDHMLCSGWLDVGGRDQCQQDSGGPLIHNGVVVGVCSWGQGCADPYYPGVNARVSAASNWIVSNA